VKDHNGRRPLSVARQENLHEVISPLKEFGARNEDARIHSDPAQRHHPLIGKVVLARIEANISSQGFLVTQ
jgi:hypothetical protein